MPGRWTKVRSVIELSADFKVDRPHVAREGKRVSRHALGGCGGVFDATVRGVAGLRRHSGNCGVEDSATATLESKAMGLCNPPDVATNCERVSSHARFGLQTSRISVGTTRFAPEGAESALQLLEPSETSRHTLPRLESDREGSVWKGTESTMSNLIVETSPAPRAYLSEGNGNDTEPPSRPGVPSYREVPPKFSAPPPSAEPPPSPPSASPRPTSRSLLAEVLDRLQNAGFSWK